MQTKYPIKANIIILRLNSDNTDNCNIHFFNITHHSTVDLARVADPVRFELDPEPTLEKT